jgi:AraC family transcriptional activator of pobA
MKYPCHSLDSYFTEGKPCLSFNFEDLHHKAPYDISKIHRHDYFEIILFEKGEGEHIIEFETYNIKDNSISVIFPRQFHQLTISKESKGKIIMFKEELFCSEILKQELRAYCIDLQSRLNYINLADSDFSIINSHFSTVENLFKDLNVLRKEQVRHIIKILLMGLIDISKTSILTKQETSESNLYLEFTTLVDNEFKNTKFVNDYSEMMGISAKKLNSLAQKYSGQSALHVIHNRILLEAKRMLAFSGLTHKEIAYELKFDSPSAFNKFIKSKTNDSPSELQFKLTNIYNKRE